MQPAWLKAALDHHRAGRLDEAERLYREVLASHPEEPDALHLLGLIAATREDYESAGRLIAAAITARPDRGDFYASLGNLCCARGQGDAMAACYRRALLLRCFRNIPASFAEIAAWAGSPPERSAFPTDVEKYQSQYLQDVLLDRWVFHGLAGGTFVDIGAHDGIKINNTYFFETVRGWRGICIEPNPAVFAQLEANRKCVTLNCCVSDRPGAVPFLRISGYSEMLSGIVEKYDPAHRARIAEELERFGGSSEVIAVHARGLNDIAAEHGLSEITYLSIDTEGSELAILAATDFRAVFVHALTVEYNYDHVRSRMTSLMRERGFEMARVLGHDLLFLNRESPFYRRFQEWRAG